MSNCGCGKTILPGEPHDCAHSFAPKWSKVYCPVCAGDGCPSCDGEGRVWPERFDAILDKYDEVRWCDCGRLALVLKDREHLCARCATRAA